MKKALFFLIIVLAFSGSLLAAEEIQPGHWVQTASTAGFAECSIEIMTVTDRILSIDASNGWKGFAYYEESSDMYSGFFELLPNSQNPDAKWRNRVFMMSLKYDGLTLTLNGKSGDLNFAATYWKE